MDRVTSIACLFSVYTTVGRNLQRMFYQKFTRAVQLLQRLQMFKVNALKKHIRYAMLYEFNNVKSIGRKIVRQFVASFYSSLSRFIA